MKLPVNFTALVNALAPFLVSLSVLHPYVRVCLSEDVSDISGREVVSQVIPS